MSLENDKVIWQHIHSVLFASFFRWVKDNHGLIFKTAGSFFEKGEQQKNRVYSSLSAESEICPACGADLRDAYPKKAFGKYIIPEFGFVASGEEPKVSGERRPVRMYSSKVFFSEYRVPGREDNDIDEQFNTVLAGNGTRIQQRYSRFGWLFVINQGNAGREFRVCKYCGKAEQALFTTTAKREKGGKPPAHKNPLTGRDCRGYFETFALGHKFMTDVLELRVEGALGIPEDELLPAWRSILYALLVGASGTMGIRREDLDGTLNFMAGTRTPSLILFDDVPGGAGHVKRMINHLPDVLTAAIERVRMDCCGPETSCTECLRNYRNQPFHDELKRGLAKRYLSLILQDCLSHQTR